MSENQSSAGDIPVESAPLRQGPGSASGVRLKKSPTGPFLLAFIPGRWKHVVIDGQGHFVPDLIQQAIRPGVNGIRINPNDPKGAPDYGPWKLSIERKGGIVLDHPELVDQYRFRARGVRHGVEVFTYFLCGFTPKRLGNEVVIRKTSNAYDRFCLSLCGDVRYRIPLGPDQELAEGQVAKKEQALESYKGAEKNAASDKLIAHTEKAIAEMRATLEASEARAEEASQELEAVRAAGQAQADVIAELKAQLAEEAAARKAAETAAADAKKEKAAAKREATNAKKKLKALEDSPTGDDNPDGSSEAKPSKRPKPPKKE